MSESDLREHAFEFVNDDFRVSVTANCSDWTWGRLICDLSQSLTKPNAVITFPNRMTAEEAESLRERIRKHWSVKA